MLSFTSLNKERMSVPPAAIRAVFQPASAAPSAILLLIGDTLRLDLLSDQYGYVKKLLVDSGMIPDPIEVKVIDQQGEGLGFFSRQHILGWLEVKDDPSGVQTQLIVDLWMKQRILNVGDSLDELYLLPSQTTPPVEDTPPAAANGHETGFAPTAGVEMETPPPSRMKARQARARSAAKRKA